MSLPENSQSASDAIELLKASVPPTPSGESGEAAGLVDDEPTCMQSVTPVSLHDREHRVPVAGVDARQVEPGRQLREADRAHATLGVALDLGDGELGVPQRHEAERDVHAAGGLAPLLDHPVVVGLHAGQRRAPCRRPRRTSGRRTAGRSGTGSEPSTQLSSKSFDPRVALPAARAHVVVGDGGHRHHRPVEPRHVAAGRGLERDGHELLVHVDEPVLVDPGSRPSRRRGPRCCRTSRPGGARRAPTACARPAAPARGTSPAATSARRAAARRRGRRR